jgi:HrpA-like RNA helicase
VSLFYTQEPLEDPVDSALVSIFQLHTDFPKGDMLVFLTGQEEIENIQSLIEEHSSELPPETEKVFFLS